jgi:hypothetical protein
MAYIECANDVKLVAGHLEESILEDNRSFNFLEFFSNSIEPIYQYSVDVGDIDLEMKHRIFKHHLIAISCDRIVLCLEFSSEFQFRLMHKKGGLIRLHSLLSPSKFLNFCANSNILFVLAKQNDSTILYEFDQDLISRRVKEVSNNCIKLSCDDNYIYLLIKKSISSLCGYCFEIYSHSIQEIERDSFHTKELDDPSINAKYKFSLETELELHSQDNHTFVFYMNDHTKIEIFSKNKPVSGIIEVRHKVGPADTYIIFSNDNRIQVFYKFNNAWYLVCQNGQIIKKREFDNFNVTDKFCVTRDGSLVVISKDLNIKLY